MCDFLSASRSGAGSSHAQSASCALALSPVEPDVVLATLHDDRFIDMAPAQVYATLLDENVYLCSERTLYRILRSAWAPRSSSTSRVRSAGMLATKPNEMT
ncbi:MAG: hypothetical protein NVS3B20_18300 [Polyangiales bacterium]